MGRESRSTLKEELRVLFHASYYNLIVTKQVCLPCKYVKLSFNYSSAKKLTELLRNYRKLTVLLYKRKMTHTLDRSNQPQVMHAHCTHVSFCTRKKYNSNGAELQGCEKACISLLGVIGLNKASLNTLFTYYCHIAILPVGKRENETRTEIY